MVDHHDTYREWRPPAEWRHVVRCCWEQTVVAERTQRVIPDGYADLLLFDTGRADVTGLHDRVDLPLLPAGTRIRGVRLRPEAVAAAFRTAGVSLHNVTVPADDVFGSAQAARLHDPRELDRWLRDLEPDRRAAAAVRLLGAHSVLDTADQLGISDRQLRRVMLDVTGLAPRTYQRVLRLQRFVVAARHAPGIADAAATAGYADQPHLTRETRSLTELTPAQLLAERG